MKKLTLGICTLVLSLPLLAKEELPLPQSIEIERAVSEAVVTGWTGWRRITSIACYITDRTCYVGLQSGAVGPSGCNNASVRWSREDPSGQDAYEMLRAAAESGRRVNLLITGTCYNSSIYPTFSLLHLAGPAKGRIEPVSDRGAGSGLVTRLIAREEATAIFTTESRTNAAGSDCVHPNWALDLSHESGRAMYSTLLSAQAQQKPVFVVGSGVCDLLGTYEIPWSVEVR